MKLTKWFDGSTQPHRPGVYECEWRDIDCMGGRWFNEWDGRQWRIGCYSAEEHARQRRRQRPVKPEIAACALRRWRGVRVDA